MFLQCPHTRQVCGYVSWKGATEWCFISQYYFHIGATKQTCNAAFWHLFLVLRFCTCMMFFHRYIRLANATCGYVWEAQARLQLASVLLFILAADITKIDIRVLTSSSRLGRSERTLLKQTFKSQQIKTSGRSSFYTQCVLLETSPVCQHETVWLCVQHKKNVFIYLFLVHLWLTLHCMSSSKRSFHSQRTFTRLLQ